MESLCGEGFVLESKKKPGPGPLPPAVLLGAGVGLVLLFALTLGAAGLILGGVLPPKTPVLALSLLAGLCALTGGRIAVVRSGGGTLIAGGLTGAILCGILAAVCLGTAGAPAFPGPWFATPGAMLAGGCLAGLMGRRKKRP